MSHESLMLVGYLDTIVEVDYAVSVRGFGRYLACAKTR